MRITNLEKIVTDDRVRLQADVEWEDCGNSAQQLYFETPAEYSGEVSANPNAFLLASIVPAAHFGEQRVYIEGEICTELRNGLETSLQILRRWFGEAKNGLPEVQPSCGFSPTLPVEQGETAVFLSGGIDSLSVLRENRLKLPLDHPDSISRGIFVHGFDLGGNRDAVDGLKRFELASGRLRDLGLRTSLRLTPVYTNLRHLENDAASPLNNMIFSSKSHGSALAAVAHIFAPVLRKTYIAASDTPQYAVHHGSHPLLDSNYGSYGLRIEHHGFRHRRHEKVAMVAAWDEALPCIRTCLNTLLNEELANCEVCEKCVRTRVGILLAGRLQDCTSFQADTVHADEILQLVFAKNTHPFNRLTLFTVPHWEVMVSPLREAGRGDLADAIVRCVEELERRKRWSPVMRRLRATRRVLKFN